MFRSNFRATLLLVASISLLSGCIESLDTSRDRIAFISANTYDTGGDTYAIRPLGVFYRASGLSLGFGEIETCQGAPFSTLPPTVANLPTMSAGQYLFTEIGGRRDTLFQSNNIGLLSYQLLTVNSIPYTPGQTFTVEVPGEAGGFPGTTLSVATSEPFTFDPPGVAEDGEPLILTWTPPSTPGSQMSVSLRLNSTGIGTTPDAQIACLFNDDGTGVVPAGLASVWRSAAPESRSFFASRIRTTTFEFDARTRVTLLSYFDRPTPLLPVQ